VLGDLNGDGIDDVIAAAHDKNTDDDAPFIILGGGQWPLNIVELPYQGNFGSPRALGDLNGDGLQDFASNPGGTCDDWIFAGASEPPFPFLGGWSTDPWMPGPCEPMP